MYTRKDLVAMYGPRMSDRICKISGKVARGRYMGYQVLEAINVLAEEYGRKNQLERAREAGKVKGFGDGICEGRAAW